ncbi:MAG: DNA repair protein RecN [Peptococcaceae bacterium]|nr:DNA repair protein RecN [Peptococcaceae bacterium]
MLERLIIRNLAVIEELDLELHAGLTVLSGETGAGKSIIVDALSLLLGGRATSDLIRTGADKAFVQGVFSISSPQALQIVTEQGEGDGELGPVDREVIITREISHSRSVCRLNGRVVTQATLKSLGEHLVDMHGQHEHQSLLYPARHLGLLDRFTGGEGQTILDGLGVAAGAYRRCKEELRDLTVDDKERARQSDILTFQIGEIKNARLRVEEEEELRAERLRLLNHEKLSSAVERSFVDLFSGQGKNKAVIDVLGRVQGDLREVGRHAPELLPIAGLVEQASYLVDDACRELGRFKDNLIFEHDRQSSIEERLDAIGKLKRKYGHSIEEVLSFAKTAQANFDRLSSSAERATQLQAVLKKHLERYGSLAADMRILREKKARLLGLACEGHLKDLGMTNAELKMAFRPQEVSAVSSTGTETVEFLFSANKGEDLKPLSKIASGGEISRVMLALKTVFSDLDDIPTLVFDEIDSGVGGKAAQAVAEKIATLSNGKQVICITHLAPIAAFADYHLCVQKLIKGEKTITEVRALDVTGRKIELARMLSGVESEVALTHAEELLSLRPRTQV